MMRKILLPVLAAIGVIAAIYTVKASMKEPPAAAPVAEPSRSPYRMPVAGAGIVEASTENIAVGTVVPGVVNEIFVRIGDEVKKSAPLFRLDDRDLRAELAVRQALVKSAEAKVKTAEASAADARNQLEMYTASDPRAVSREERDRKKFAMQIAEAQLAQAQADALSAAAQVKSTETEIDRRLVRAPVDGEILQIKIRLGEFAPAGVVQTPLMLIGETRTLHVRVDVDENDAWRIHPNAQATATVRGNPQLKTPMKFVRIEPYVVPKRSLTGESTERVDTRVLQILYSFDRGAIPVYVGQQMDVFIDAPPLAAVSSTQSNGEESDAKKVH